MKTLKCVASAVAVGVFSLALSAQEIASAKPVDDFVPAVSAGAASRSIVVAPATTHKFFDRQQLLALYVHSGMRVVDTIKTCRELSHGGMEDWIPTQSCGGIAAWQAGSVGVALGVGWLFHKHGHHRLERITPWVGTSASAAGWTKSVLNIH
jgi:hypothetical protein